MGKVMTSVRIHNRTVTPKSQHVPLGDQVEFDSDEDCTVMFYDGSGTVLYLKAGMPGTVDMTEEGIHHFHVVYDVDSYSNCVAEVQEKVSGTRTVMLSLTMKTAAVPTGDILVP